MTDTSSKVDENEKESKQPMPDAISVIPTTDHQQPLDKATKSVQEDAIVSEVKRGGGGPKPYII